MKTEQIIKTLQEYNDWRRAKGKWDVDTSNKGESFFDTITAHEIGFTIDSAIERLQTLEKERDEARSEAEKKIKSAWQKIETAPPRKTVVVGGVNKVGAGYCDEINRWFVYGTSNISMEKPTHWMPFPSPPNK